MMDENKGVVPDKLKELKVFFHEDELEWLPMKIGKYNGEYRILLCPYMNRVAVMNRLDAVIGPENWQDEYITGPGGGVLCRLSIRINGEWITKCDGADNTQIEAIKGGLSDAFKRAATKWDVGRYLSQFPKMYGIINVKGKQNAKYKPKKGNVEWFKYDIPPVPAEWLPPKKESPEVIALKTEIENIMGKIPSSVFSEDKRNWVNNKMKTGFTEGEARRTLARVKKYFELSKEPPGQTPGNEDGKKPENESNPFIG